MYGSNISSYTYTSVIHSFYLRRQPVSSSQPRQQVLVVATEQLVQQPPQPIEHPLSTDQAISASIPSSMMETVLTMTFRTIDVGNVHTSTTMMSSKASVFKWILSVKLIVMLMGIV